jgi:hypothetical protein
MAEAPGSSPSVWRGPRCRTGAAPSAVLVPLQRTAECISQCDAEAARATARAHCPRVYRARRRVVDPVRPLAPGRASPAAARVRLPVLYLVRRPVEDRWVSQCRSSPSGGPSASPSAAQHFSQCWPSASPSSTPALAPALAWSSALPSAGPAPARALAQWPELSQCWSQ